MKVIKKFWAPIFIICFLLLGYVIGQVRNSVKAGQEQQTEVTDVSEVVTESTMDSDLDDGDEWNFFNLVFENSEETSDNPWGYTAGLIDVDGDCRIFLTPNTGVVMYPKELGDAYVLKAYIHSWVSDSSDGVGLVIWYLDENDEILGREEISVGANGEKAEIAMDLDQFQGTNHFKRLCNNGDRDDDSGDWVVISASGV
jgi:hypothetical protein